MGIQCTVNANSQMNCGSWRPNELLGNISVECWIYKYSHAGTIISQNINGATGGGINYGRFSVSGVNPVSVAVTMSGAGSLTAVSTTTLALNTWHHVAFTFAWDAGAQSVKLYINGVLEGVKSNFGYNQTGLGLSNVIIGNSNATVSNLRFDGVIDEVRIWNRTLTLAEINHNMYKRILPGENGLERCWRLDDDTLKTTSPGIYYFKPAASDVASYLEGSAYPAESNLSRYCGYFLQPMPPMFLMRDDTDATRYSKFLTPSGVPGVTAIPAGWWRINYKVEIGSSCSSGNVYIYVYKRSSGGVETELFNTSKALTLAPLTTPQVQEYSAAYNLGSVAMLNTDRLVVYMYMLTDNTPTVFFNYSLSSMVTPLAPQSRGGSIAVDMLGAGLSDGVGYGNVVCANNSAPIMWGL